MSGLNLYLGWMAVLTGLVTGTGIGLFFHQRDWLGGYDSWKRRMLRLGHVALIGTGLLNILFALSVGAMGIEPTPRFAAVMFLIGGATMPTVCFLSAWRTGFRHLFFIPVLSLLLAVGNLLFCGLLR